MFLVTAPDLTLPLSNPVLKFLVILMIILIAPILFNKIRIPQILGLIIAGAIIGPNGFNLILRDSGIILSGTAGLLYIMFLAGLEINISDFKKNGPKSIIFGLYTFIIPMTIGTLAGLYLLNFSILTSILLASMFASHTLIAYPILSRLGVIKTRAVTIAVGGTVITDTLALLVLAIIVGMATGTTDSAYWTTLSIALLLVGFIILWVFPIIGRWFLKRYEDSVSQFIFILVMVFLGAVLVEFAGVEAIIGAFLAGLALNRLIPSTSPLMNRIEFVGNAIFIPFFLISVGMLLDYRVFFKGYETLKVAVVITTVATISKYMAAWLTQKTYKMTVDERRIIFGLSNAQAAATLAAVLVGYNVIIGHTETGEPIRLLNESILNGVIVMILITCTIATFQAQKGGENLSMELNEDNQGQTETNPEKILIPLLKNQPLDESIEFTTIFKSKENKDGIFLLKVIPSEDEIDSPEVQEARRIMEKASKTIAAADISLTSILRSDIGIATAISNVIKEQKITDILIGLESQTTLSNFINNEPLNSILKKSNVTTVIYRPAQPISTIKKHLVVIPRNAEREIGFAKWLAHIWKLAINSGGKITFYCTQATSNTIRKITTKYPIEATFKIFDNWYDFLIIARDVRPDDALIVAMSREKNPSYHKNMERIPYYIDKYFSNNSVILFYPEQINPGSANAINLTNASMTEPLEMFDELGQTFAKIFRR